MTVAIGLALAYMVAITVVAIIQGFSIAELEGRVKQQTERADRWKEDHERLMVIYGDALRKVNNAREALDSSADL